MNAGAALTTLPHEVKMATAHPIPDAPAQPPRYGLLGLTPEGLAAVQFGSAAVLMSWGDLAHEALQPGNLGAVAAFLLDEFARCRYRLRHGLSWTPLLLTLAEVLRRTR